MTNKKKFIFLLLSLGMMLFGYALLLLNKRPMFEGLTISDFLIVPWLIIEFLLALFLEYVILIRKRNEWLFPCAFFLANFSVLILGRLEDNLMISQIRWIIVGILACFVTLRFDWMIRKLLNYKYLWGILCFILFTLTIFKAQNINGIANCIMIGNIRLQPLEFIKILFVFFLAAYLGNTIKTNNLQNRKNSLFKLLELKFFILILCLCSFLLFVITNDLANSLIIFSVTVFLTYIGTSSKTTLFIPIICFVLCLAISYFTHPNIKIVFDTWLDPRINSSDFAKQTIESLFSFMAGGIWGEGFTMGYSNFIFEVHINSVFQIIAEDFGLVGIICIMLIYILFFYQSVTIAFKLKNESEIFLSYGIGLLFFIQMFITVCAVVNILPIVNNVLPFMNYGASSMVSNFILLGVLISISRKANYNG